jgi:hypothetical protein
VAEGEEFLAGGIDLGIAEAPLQDWIFAFGGFVCLVRDIFGLISWFLFFFFYTYIVPCGVT